MKEARRFADAIHANFPGKLLAYNCSPSFNWKAKLSETEIADFQRELGKMGYKFQFVTLAGFHALNLSMFELARDYAHRGMSAYSQLQQREFQMAQNYNYGAVKHQRFVGTGYFDSVATVISSGQTSTCALAGSTEAEQFETKSSNGHGGAVRTNGHAKNGNGHLRTNGSEPSLHVPEDFPAIEEDEVALMPSGD
jgi:isocitrate lyase